MKLYKNTLAILALSSLSALSFSANAAIYEIDPHHAHARFFVNHFGTSTNAGGFYGLKGEVEYSPEKSTGSVDIIIPIENLDTGIPPFTKHLKSADFFNVTKYPTAHFKSTKWTFNGDKVDSVTGNLTLLDQTHPITLKSTSFNCYDNPILKTKTCGGDFETVIDRTQWGINMLTDGNMMKDVTLKIQIEAGLKK